MQIGGLAVHADIKTRRVASCIAVPLTARLTVGQVVYVYVSPHFGERPLLPADRARRCLSVWATTITTILIDGQVHTRARTVRNGCQMGSRMRGGAPACRDVHPLTSEVPTGGTCDDTDPVGTVGAPRTGR